MTVGPNVNLSKLPFSQTEATLAINPTNPNNLVAFSNDDSLAAGIRQYLSSDGGATWTARIVGVNDGFATSACCDTQAAFDEFGNLYAVTLDFTSPPRITVSRSTDGGNTLARVATFISAGKKVDQPSIAVGAGMVWISYADFNVNKIVAAGATSTALGVTSVFSSLQEAPNSDNSNFGNIAISPGGQVLVGYQNPNTGTGPGSIFTNLDPDGLGPVGFQAQTLATVTNVGANTPIPPQNFGSSYTHIDSEANIYYDKSGGPRHGRSYMVYTDSSSPGSADTNIFARFSDDNGATWSPRVKVNDDVNLKSHFLPQAQVDPTTGYLGVAWYDSRNSPTGGPQDDRTAQIFATVSIDGGLTFLPNVQVSPGTSENTGIGTTNYGDFMLMEFFRGVFRPIWADNSNSTGDNPDNTMWKDIYSAAVVVDTAPILTSIAIRPDPVAAGRPATLSVAFTDPEAFETHTATINWGDNSADTIVNLAAGVFSFSSMHTFTSSGDFTVKATLSDRTGPVVESSTTAHVLAAPATVYVDEDWVGTPPGGNPVLDPISPQLIFGYNAFADVQSGIDAGSPTLVLFGGSYAAAANFNKPGTTVQIDVNSKTPNETLVTIDGPVTIGVATTFNLSPFAPGGGNPTQGPADLTFGGIVSLGASTTIASSSARNITFAGAVQSPTHSSLTLNTAGVTTFGGAVGGGDNNSNSLGALTTNAGGRTRINGGGVNTSGFAQNYNDDVTLGSAFTIFAGIVNINAGFTLGTGPTTATSVAQVAGTLNFASTATLTTTIAGTASSQIGHMLVGGGNTTYGNATLALVYNNFTPAPGDNFDVVSNGGFGIGQFQNAPAPGPTTINGIPYLITYSGTDGGGDFILTVAQAPAITSVDKATFLSGTQGAFAVTATGFPAPTFSLKDAPAWLTLDAVKGTLLGTPPNLGAGPYTFRFTITASNGIGSNATQDFTLTVNQEPAITSAASATFLTGQFNEFSVAATGNPPPTLSVSGALPTGVQFDARSGALSGFPTANSTGVYLLTVKADNNAGLDAFAIQSFTLTVLSLNQRFVENLYEAELGRSGDVHNPNGAGYWVKLLDSGAMTRAQVAAGVVYSLEASQRLVEGWYETFLGRSVRGLEAQGWVDLLQQRVAEESVLSQILGSPEFFNRAQSLIATGSPQERYVQTLYSSLLDRSAMANEVAFWVSALTRLGQSGVALGILTSREYRDDLFTSDYELLLHRAAQDGEQNYWVLSNLNAAEVRIGIESSTEFFERG